MEHGGADEFKSGVQVDFYGKNVPIYSIINALLLVFCVDKVPAGLEYRKHTH